MANPLPKIIVCDFRYIANLLKNYMFLVFCTMIFLLQIAPLNAQGISLNIKKGSIVDVFKVIEEQSNYKFFYNNNQIDVSQQIDVVISGGTIESVLNEIFEGTNITYEIVNNHVVLTNKDVQILPSKSIQQNIQIRGRVTDQNYAPLSSVNVIVKGSDLGTVTDLEGNYVVDVPKGSILTFSYIGYEAQNVKVNGNSLLNIALHENTHQLDEVVVVGYGTFMRSDLTGAISHVRESDIMTFLFHNAADALQGKAAGVSVAATSGSPGSMSTVRVRGVGTINNNAPLYVVDGLPQDEIGWLNSRDIESMEVLKDASAQAIYGARAANGVILISTKRGIVGDSYRSNIEFEMNIGFQGINKRYDMLDAEGFMEYKNRAYTAAGKSLIEDFSTPEKRKQILDFLAKNGSRTGTDWWAETTRKPVDTPVQNYNLAFSGGTTRLRYRTSFAYLSQEGIFRGSNYDRLSGRLNMDTEVFKWLNLSANVNVIYELKRNLQENDPYTATVFNTVTADPITPVYRNNLIDIPDFLYDRIMGGYEPSNPWSQYTGIIYSNKWNAVAQADRLALNKWSGIQIKTNVSGEIKLFPFLTFRSRIAVDLYRGMTSVFNPKFYLDGDEYNTYAKAIRRTYATDYWVFDNYFTYNQKFGKHAINLMLGTSAEKNCYEEIGTAKQGMASNDPSQQIISAGTLNPEADGYIAVYALNSYFGRLFYSFDNKYMITTNIRWDGSSAFAQGNKWGCFPSISVGWNFNQEDFMSKYDWLTQGKLRLGWGEIGNQNIRYTTGAYLKTYGNGNYYLFGESYNPSISGGRVQVGNPDLKWETTRQINVGLDLSFFNNILKVNFDYFNRQTKDMLVQVPLPTALGLPNTPWMNAGSVVNRGIELAVGYNGKIGDDFIYNVSGNISTYRNKVKSLGGGTNIPGKKVHLEYYTYTMTEPGMPIGYYYGFKTNGVFQTEKEIEDYRNNGRQVMPSAKPGDLKFVDLNRDGKLDDNDRAMVGNPHPDFIFGFTLSAEYKGFDFSAFFQGSVGNDILNILKYDIYSGTGWYNAPKNILSTFWNGPGSTNKNFGIDADTRMNLEMSDWYVENGSYIRLKALQLGYTIPRSFTSKFTINNLRVFVTAQNLFTITGYSGLDPEIGEFRTEPMYTGIDMGFYPQSKIFSFGISLKL